MLDVLRRPLVALAFAVLVLASCDDEGPGHRVIVIGVDGMDPQIARRLMDEGRMPNFKRLAGEGGFAELGTSIPPESPVAWSNFITGRNPGGHGVFDFLHYEWHQDPESGEWSFVPVDSIAGAEEPGASISLFGYELPLSGGDPINKRVGDAFWQVLERHDVPATVFKIPANYPPVETGEHTHSGMGTPDLKGGYGTYFVYTDDPFAVSDKIKAGEVVTVSIYDGSFRDFLYGPENTLVEVEEGRPHPVAKTPLRVDIDPEEPIVRILVGDEEDAEPVVLREGEWSDYVPVTFELVPHLVTIDGITRFHLQQVRPTFRLFVDPINFDPRSPAIPLCTPDDWSAEIAERYGLYETKGMPENTKALDEGALDDDEYREYSQMIWKRRKELLFDLLGEHKDGLFFFYFSSIDLNSHMMWRCMDPNHPAHDADTSPENAGFIEWLYEDLDRVVGRVMEGLRPDDTLVVMSDHGFAPFYRKVHLNTWLREKGYLVLKEGADPEAGPAAIDWSRTRAFNFGFQTIYFNLEGRDPMGIVKPSEADALARRIRDELLALTDPKTGKRAVKRVYLAGVDYDGEAMAHAPALVVGFDREYRNSDESTQGQVTETVFEDNTGEWSGCHLMAAEVVPGVLFANRPIRVSDPKLYDLTATLLAEYGIEPPEGMVGRPIWNRVRP